MHKSRLNHLKDRGFCPKTCVDIGCNVGDWTEMFQSVFPACNIKSIEANPACGKELKKRNLNYQIALLGSNDRDYVNFFIEKNDFLSGGASIYLEKTHYYNDYYTVQLPTETLDSLGDEFDFIKMDVQGSELDVLLGGTETVKKSEFVLIEASVIEYNQGAPLSNVIIEYMDSIGFLIYDIFELHYDTFYKKNYQLLEIDFCFVNKELRDKYISKW